MTGRANAKNGVITIPINYRLGSLGTFAHPALTAEGAATGGYALMDAVAALEWVKRNAAAFGGDPNNVTLAGQSAGAAMVVNLLSIPSAKGLYHKAVIQSGALLGPPTPLADAEKKGVEGAKALGLGDGATAAQLRSISAQTHRGEPGDAARHDPAYRRQVQDDGDAGCAQRRHRDRRAGADRLQRRRRRLRRRTHHREAGGRYRRRRVALQLHLRAGLPESRMEERRDPFGRDHVRVRFRSDLVELVVGSRRVRSNDKDKAVAKRVNSCWVAFFKMDPKAKSLTCADGFTWPAYTDAGDDAAQFGDTPKLVKSKTIPNGPPPATPAAASTPAN